MAFDWQTIAVALIILAALLYVVRRGVARLRSFSLSAKSGGGACATGCGKCGEEQTVGSRPTLVQIGKPPGATGRTR
jgi:hypothetical protein